MRSLVKIPYFMLLRLSTVSTFTLCTYYLLPSSSYFVTAIRGDKGAILGMDCDISRPSMCFLGVVHNLHRYVCPNLHDSLRRDVPQTGGCGGLEASSHHDSPPRPERSAAILS